MNAELQVGDRVTFDYENTRWKLNKHNPVGVAGTVTEVDSSVIVDWDNGEWNAYSISDEDLIILV